MAISELTKETLPLAAADLSKRDPDFLRIFKQHGPPPLWSRRPGFITLIQIILEQQVSLSSAAAVFKRLRQQVVPFRPEQFLKLGPKRIAACGLTRQKTEYCLHLSQALVSRKLNLTRLRSLSDTDAKTELLKLKGIGSWSADVYLLMALLRSDIWPAGDLALAIAVRDVKQLKTTPSPPELIEWGERWRPLRSVAARMLWQSYLAKRAAKGRT